MNDFEKANTDFLERFGVDYGYLQPTANGLRNNIIDARIEYREFLSRQKIHDYETQAFGREINGRNLPASFIRDDYIDDLPEASLYRARRRGDRRIWFPEIPLYVRGGETLTTLWLNGQFWLLNASRLTFSESPVLAALIQKNSPVPHLREYLIRIGALYDPQSLHSAGHILMRRAPEVLQPVIPGGLKVVTSGGNGEATLTPWIAILDPDEAITLEDGIYLVWIFKQDLKEVVLTLNQGATALSNQLGTKPALPILRAQADSIRRALGLDLHGLDDEVDFGQAPRQAAYAAANIASKTYILAEMPSMDVVQQDLQRMLHLYQDAVWAKKNMNDGAVSGAESQTGDASAREPAPVPREFKPKDRQDYLVQIQGRTESRRGSRHELLLAQYAELAEKLGHQPSNTGVHPRDLTLQVRGEEWLVEAKVVYNGNASQAARAALGQLFEYSYFLYEGSPPRKMALFTEPLEGAFVGMFDALAIGVVWKGPNGWDASPLAREAGLV